MLYFPVVPVCLCVSSAPLAFLTPGVPLIMRCHQLRVSVLSALSILAAAPLANFATSLARPWDDIRFKHTWNAVPPHWDTLGHPPADTTIDLHVALKAHNENALIDALYRVSDPRSPKHVLSNTLPRTIYSRVPLLRRRYGAHLSKEQVAQLVAPHPDTLELIYSWLEHHGVPSSSISTTHGGSWLTLTGVPVTQANKLLGASYKLYRPIGTNDTAILRTIGYALPAVLHTHVQTVAPTTYFASTRSLWQTQQRRSIRETADMASRELVTTLSSRVVRVTPSDLRWLYKTSGYVPVATDRNKIGITGFLNDYPSPVDLAMYMTEYRSIAVPATYLVQPINGGKDDPTHPSAEANVNMQLTQAMAYPTPNIFYSTGGNIRFENKKPGTGDVWMEWLNYVLSQPNVPQTIVTPYSNYERNFPLEYTTTLCRLFAQLGLRGASVIVTSGNKGVGPEDCVAKDGSGRVQFMPEFPSTCMCSVLFLLRRSTPSGTSRSPHRHCSAGPYVTSVGGTTGLDSEVAAMLSGGGFSNHFPRESYQDDAVLTFLKHLGSKYNGLYKCVFCRDLT